MASDSGHSNGDKAWVFATSRVVSHALVVGPFALLLWVLGAIINLQENYAALSERVAVTQNRLLENRRTLNERGPRIRELEKELRVLQDRSSREKRASAKLKSET